MSIVGGRPRGKHRLQQLRSRDREIDKRSAYGTSQREKRDAAGHRRIPPARLHAAGGWLFWLYDKNLGAHRLVRFIRNCANRGAIVEDLAGLHFKPYEYVDRARLVDVAPEFRRANARRWSLWKRLAQQRHKLLSKRKMSTFDAGIAP